MNDDASKLCSNPSCDARVSARAEGSLCEMCQFLHDSTLRVLTLAQARRAGLPEPVRRGRSCLPKGDRE